MDKALLKTSQGNLKLNNVLASISQFIDDNCYIFKFNFNWFAIEDHNRQILVEGHRQGNVYALKQSQIKALTIVIYQRASFKDMVCSIRTSKSKVSPDFKK